MPHNHDPTSHFNPCPVERTPSEIRANHDLANIPDKNRDTLVHRYCDVLESRKSFYESDTSYYELYRARLKHLCSNIDVGPPDRVYHIHYGQTVVTQPVGIYIDLILFNIASD